MATVEFDNGMGFWVEYWYGHISFEWELVSQSIENNTSTINWKYYIWRPFEITSTSKKSYAIKIDGTTIASGTTTINGWDDGDYDVVYKTIKTGTTTLSHKADGTLSFTVQISQEIKATIEGEYVGTFSGSNTFQLPTIPRPTVPTLETDNLFFENEYTITLNRNLPDLKHRLTCRIETTTRVINWNIDETYVWKPSISAYGYQIPNTTSQTATLICETYRRFEDGTSILVGTQEKTIILNVPDFVVPEIESINVTETVENSFEKFSAFIQNESKPVIEIIANGAYGSTIESYKVAFDGQTHNEQTVSCEKIAGSGMLPIVATVTDSRGRTATKTIEIEVLPYFRPTVGTTTYRGICPVDRYTGINPDPEGTTLWVAPVFNVCPLNDLNVKSVVVRYRVTGSETWTEKPITSIAGYTSDGRVQSLVENILDVDNSYEIAIVVSDFFNSDEKIFSIPTGFTLVDFKSSGKGIGFGKVSELDGVMDVGLQTKFTGGLLFDVIDTTTDLDTFTIPNTYTIAKDRTYTNSPADGVNAVLTVSGRADECLFQSFKIVSKTDSRTFERFYDADGWGEWNESGANLNVLSVYPVGSIYMSVNSASPATLFGGTWEQIKDTFLLSAGDTYAAGSTGGEATHTLTINEMPSHDHTAQVWSRTVYATGSVKAAAHWSEGDGKKSLPALSKTGGGAAHNNMPPYLTVYVWKRTA